MRSIKARFNQSQSVHPEWSSFICFSSAISDQKFCLDNISRNFNKLVDKQDYEADEKREIIDFLFRHSNGLRSTRRSKNRLIFQQSQKGMRCLHDLDDVCDLVGQSVVELAQEHIVADRNNNLTIQ